MSEITTHAYGFSPTTCAEQLFNLSYVKSAFLSELDQSRALAGNRSLNCGECGSCWGGGQPNASDAFGSFVWYISSLVGGESWFFLFFF